MIRFWGFEVLGFGKFQSRVLPSKKVSLLPQTYHKKESSRDKPPRIHNWGSEAHRQSIVGSLSNFKTPRAIGGS